LEAVYETRPRKVYELLPEGEKTLDQWLRRSPTMAEVIEEYDVAMHKFLVAERRLSRTEVLDWLDAYEQNTNAARDLHHVLAHATAEEAEISVHTRLIQQSLLLEVEARLTWIATAKARLRAL